jgi:ribokinase
MKPRITVVGSLNMDLVIRSPHIPQPGETILGSDFQTIPGGKGANQAVAAARLGGEVSMVGRLGQDSFAGGLLDNLADSGVDTAHVQKDAEAPTGVALIVVDDNGENSIVVASGANMRLTEADVQDAERVIAEANVLILQLEVPLAAVIRSAQIAREHEVPVILNPAPARELPGEMFELVDVLIPNETETALLSGQRSRNTEELMQAAHKLLECGVGSVVVTHGKRGALLVSNEHGSIDFEAFKIDPVDTTAAGDAFAAGLAVHLAAGHPLPEAIQWGNAAGALAAMRFGAQTSAPSHDEVEKLINGVNPDKIIEKGL